MLDAMPRKIYGETGFGERLQAIRKARGLTQVQLAEAAGVSQLATSSYETEAAFPPAPAIVDRAKALKVSADELLGIKPHMGDRLTAGAEARRMWKRLQMVVAVPQVRGNGAQGERHGH